MSFEASILRNIEGKLCAIDAGINKLNMGGVIELVAFEHNSVESMPDYNIDFNLDQKAIFSGNINLFEAAAAYYFRFSPETADFKETMRDDDNGISYEQLIMLAIPKNRPEIAWIKHKMRNPRYIFAYRDANGLTQLVGRPGLGLKCKMDLNTQKTFAGFNGHNFTARRASLQPAVFWDVAADQPLTNFFE